MTHIYDWSKLDAGWRYSAPGGGTLIFAGRVFAISDVKVSDKPRGWADGEYATLWPQARAQLAKCRVVEDFLLNRDQAHEHQRKHEATHGWRNPPCIYEESNDEHV